MKPPLSGWRRFPPEGDNASGPAQPVPRRSPYSTLRADDSAHEGA